MTTTGEMLQRLEQATNYQSLQSLFNEFAALAGRIDAGSELAATIDEAIRRIESERARDQDELQQFESDYASFKDQQRGIVGWFKRNMPFTETRRIDRGHHAAVNDQQAEVLADNFVIARAQMLKQQLLPVESRSLGLPVDRWQSKMQLGDSAEQLRQCGVELLELTRELEVAQVFVGEVSKEIKAFEQADFSDAGDRRRQKEDLKAAGMELSALEKEIADKQSLRNATIDRVGKWVASELSRNQSEFRELVQRIERLGSSERLAKRTVELVEELGSQLDNLHKAATQAEELMQQNQASQSQHVRCTRELDDARRMLEVASQQFAPLHASYQAAKQESDQAEAALKAASRVYERHCQTAAETVDEANDPVYAEYLRVQSERQDARHALADIAAPYDAAQAQHAAAQQAVKHLESQLMELERARDDSQCKQNDIASQRTQGEAATAKQLNQLQPLLHEYLASVARFDFQSRVVLLERSADFRSAMRNGLRSSHRDSWTQPTPDSGPTALQQHIQGLSDALKNDAQELVQRLSASDEERARRFAERCRELLGQQVASWVCSK